MKNKGILSDCGSRRIENVIVRIKISYVNEEDLKRIIDLLNPVLKSYRVSSNNTGQYKKAYAELDV